MIVISDTSVISNLIIIGELDILRDLYGAIIIPSVVDHEIRKLAAFEIDLSAYISSGWIHIGNPSNTYLEDQLRTSLDAGESAAIDLIITLFSHAFLPNRTGPVARILHRCAEPIDPRGAASCS